MKIEEFIDQLDIIKKQFKHASNNLDCDDIDIVFKTDTGKIVEINVVEGGYLPISDTLVLMFSSGENELKKIMQKMETHIVDASDIDIGEKIGDFDNDENH